ncbi:MAG TPA: ATP-binding protein [Caldisericia bacterium]|nr:ATP-binding protein [Caldisericia bacterium]HRV75569.1 ATP-binding protein [Caldisericia bacterium]
MSKKKSFFWKLFPLVALLTTLGILVVVATSLFLFNRFHIENTSSDLNSRAKLIEPEIRALVVSQNYDEIDDVCKRLGQSSGTRITVILPDGVVVGDSLYNPVDMDNHKDRPEVARALNGNLDSEIRFSDTLDEDFVYHAIPLTKGTSIVGALRTSIPLVRVQDSIRNVYLFVGLIALVLLLLSAALALFISRRFSEPIETIRDTVEEIERGNFDARIPTFGIYELDLLSQSVNTTTRKLSHVLGSSTRQKHQLKNIISKMNEGLIVVDSSHVIRLANHAAREMFELKSDQAGKFLQEVIRNKEFIDFAESLGEESKPTSVVISTATGRHLKISGVCLKDYDEKLFVATDVTQLVKLEQVKREFIANASHELKTPITAIKGFADILATEDDLDKEKREAFTKKIAARADEMSKLIDDILSLAHLENTKKRDDTKFEGVDLVNLIKEVTSRFTQAYGKGIQIELKLPDECVAIVDPSMIERALINLLENAIKYSSEGEKVIVNLSCEQFDFEISVVDFGAGIPAKECDRIFERFYRLERDRKIEGTGLGLSIVKHVATAHGGSVSVVSEIGKGSTFMLRIPNKPLTND